MKLRAFYLAAAAAVTISLSAGGAAAVAPVLLFDFESETGAPIAADSTASLAVDGMVGSGLQTTLFASDVPGFGGTNPFTIFGSFQMDTSEPDGNVNQTIFGYSPSSGGTAGADIRLYARTDGQIRAEASAGAGSNFAPAEIDPFDGQPHTIALIAAGGENFNDMDVYLDGVLFENPFTAGNNALMDLGAGGGGFPISVGRDRDGVIGANRTFNGLLDDVAVFASALTVEQLDDLRLNGVPGAVPEPTGLLLIGMATVAALATRR